MSSVRRSDTERNDSVKTLKDLQSDESYIPKSTKRMMSDKVMLRTILLVQFQTQFMLVILLGILGSYCIVLHEAADALSVMMNEQPLTSYLTDTKGIVYAFDAFYVVDIVIMVIYKNTNWPDLHHRYPPRNSFILLIEILALIPIDAVYYNITPKKTPSAVALLRLRYIFRLIRVYSQYKIPRSITKGPSKLKLSFHYFVFITLISATIGFVVQVYICNFTCSMHNTEAFLHNLYIAAEKITGKGFGEVQYHHHLENESLISYGLSICSFCSYIIFAYITAKVISIFFPENKIVYAFLIKYATIKNKVNQWKRKNLRKLTNYEDSLCVTITTYYQMIWNKKKWYIHELQNNEILPSIMFKDIRLEISWNALKHSHLFKNQDINFLREIAHRMHHTSYAPGEVIYNRRHRKARMVYIATGIAQILSEENGETPIISFSGGTCLGEASLLIDYSSSWTVVCKTYCEVVYLSRRDFITISLLYPEVYQRLRDTIIKRYERAKHLRNVYDFQWLKYNITNQNTLLMKWFKFTLHTLIGNETGNQIFWYESFAFYPDYLDMLVITEDLELVVDQIFLKKQFPPIFQPESIFLEGWNALMATISLVILLGYPCYMLFCNQISGSQHAVTYLLITCISCVDIFIQCTTAVRTKNSLLSNVSLIMYYRLTCYEFLIDVFSVAPFSIVLRIVYGHLRYESLLLAECHKLLKAYRISFLLKKIENINYFNKYILSYVKVFLFDFFLFYYTALIFYYIVCRSSPCSSSYLETIKSTSNPNRWYILLHLYSLSSLFIGNMSYVDFIQFVGFDWILIIVFLQFLYLFMSVYVLAFAAITETSTQSKTYQYKEYVSTIDTMLEQFQVKGTLRARVKSYLKDHFWFDKGLRVLIPDLLRSSMSSNLFSVTQQIWYGTFLRGTSLFVECDDSVIREASRKLKSNFYPDGEVVSYSGQLCKEIYMIQFGFCKVVGSTSIFGPGESFCALETCLQIPTFYTVITVTDCKILSMSYHDYVHLAVRFPTYKESFQLALDSSFRDKIQQIETAYDLWDYTHVEQGTKVPIARIFAAKKMTANETKIFQEQFSGQKVIFRYLVMRFTFPANGRFIFYWELCRLLFTFATNILSPFAGICPYCALHYVLLVLDITSWVDLYVRLHICYYNQFNIEVSHPLKTAKHYIQNGFLIDFIAAAPLDYLGINISKVYLRMNRILQLHRSFNFVKYINNSTIARSKLYDISKYIPLTILVLSCLRSIGFYISCSLLVEDGEPECFVSEWAYLYLNDSSVSIYIKQEVASMVITTMAITLIGFTRFQLATTTELVVCCLMILSGHMLFIWITAKLVANSFYRKTDLSQHQEAMKQLLSFVNYKNVDKNIKLEIINHFENMWKKTKGKNIVLLLSSLNIAIKEDILYDMFGWIMRNSSIFENVPNGFFRSLLQEAKYEVYIHKGIIYHVNDVHGNVFVLLKGSIEIVGPDYNTLSTLNVGSVFGNLDECERSRHTLMMVAKGNVEVLKLTATYFHRVISKYPLIMKKFRRLTAINVDYLQNMFIQKTSAAVIVEEQQHRNERFMCASCYCGVMKVYKDNRFLKSLQYLIIFLACFCGYHLEIFQFVCNDTIYIAVLYGLDLLYLLRMYLRFHTTFINEAGLVVADRRLVARHYLHEQFGFYFDLASTLPLEVVSLFLLSDHNFVYAFTWLRKNRLLRILVCLSGMKRNEDKLNINVRLMRLYYIAIWITIILQSMATLLLAFRILEETEELSSTNSIGLLLRAYQIIIYTASGAALTNLKIKFNMYTAIIIIILMLVSRFCISLFIAETCSVLENTSQNKRKYQAYVIKLKYFMKEENVSTPLRKRIGEYFNLLWIHHKGVQLPHLLKESPYYLREAILNGLYGFHLRKHLLLKHCHKDLIRQMAACFEILIFFPGNFVVYVGDIDGCMYFIHKGEVSAVIEDTLSSETSVDTLVTGDCFGFDQGLYENCGHNYSYKVTKKSVIIGLNRSKWFHLLTFFPASKRVLFELRDEYMYKEKNFNKSNF